MRNAMGFEVEFAELTPEQVEYIETAEFGKYVVKHGEIERTIDALGLREVGRDGLQAVRNSVVRHLADLGSAAREAGDWDTFDRTRRNMSAITAVIDNRVYAA